MAVGAPLVATGAILLAVLAAFPAGWAAPTSGLGATGTSSGAFAASATAPLGTVSDSQTISTAVPHASTLQDTIVYSGKTLENRTYTIHLTASYALPLDRVTVTTFPIVQWGLPDQLPGGIDNLPPLDLWNWTITDDGVVVTPLWTVTNWDAKLTGVTTWSNQTIEIRGTTFPQVAVAVTPSQPDGAYAPSVGIVMNTPGSPGIPANDSTFTSTAATLGARVVHFSTSGTLVAYSWNAAKDWPNFNFTHFDQLFAFAEDIGAKVMISFPAGTWGDGNLLPHGMPVNTSVAVPGPAGSGYLAASAAYVQYIKGVVDHTIAHHEVVAYWSIGNEFPTRNASLVAAYTSLFNVAEATIHGKLPHALVGSDVMTNGTYETYFAQHAKGVGFLSFHYYSSATLCVVNGTYCPPRGSPHGSTDVGIFDHSAYKYLVIDNSPAAAQGLWHNLTGTWVPVFNSETNLNPTGGSFASTTIGTDPRTQTLYGASWLVSLLIDSALANVTQVDYNSFSSGYGLPRTLTSPYGGWGYGLTDEAPNGSNVRFAPYYAMELWTHAVPAGAAGLEAVSSQPSVIHVFAVRDGDNLSVVLENRVEAKVNVSVALASGAYRLAEVAKLDATTYDEVYAPTTQTTVLERAGILTNRYPTSSAVTIDGYGVAVLTYVASGASARTAGSAHLGPARDHGRASGPARSVHDATGTHPLAGSAFAATGTGTVARASSLPIVPTGPAPAATTMADTRRPAWG